MSEYNAKTKTKKIKNSSSNRQNWKIFDEEIKKKPSIECIYDVSDNANNANNANNVDNCKLCNNLLIITDSVDESYDYIVKYINEYKLKGPNF